MRSHAANESLGGSLRSEGLGDGFTLIEVMVALAILALTASSVVFVVNQSVSSAADSVRRMEAFQLARENMERVLSSNAVTETVEFGTSEVYPDISWRTVVEAFSETADGTSWLRAVCSAEFMGSTGETQKVELVHWLVPLTDQQAAQFMGDEDISSLVAEQVVADIDGAAKYAGVDTGTIQKWLANGLVVMSDGTYVRYNLDIYVRSKGNPADAARMQQVHSIEELATMLKNVAGGSQDETPQAVPQEPAGERPGARPILDNPAGQGGLIPSLRGRGRSQP